ncbi:MAG: hydroxyethylthiazole kinase [Schwartzia sp. (in: firmicutes)]
MIKELQQEIGAMAARTRALHPLVPSITNTVTVNFVANAQLAVGGSAAMVYLPDEGAGMAKIGASMYINMGTLLPIYEETLPEVAKTLCEAGKPWVLDPVGMGIGALRTKILREFQAYRPTILRGNASEILALAHLWELKGEREGTGVRGVDATDSVEAAQSAAVALARSTGGAVAVSGATDLVTDGRWIARIAGGSHFFPLITGAGCSLGGVIAVYAAAGTPFAAALGGTVLFNLAGREAEGEARGPASFQSCFLDALYRITPEALAAYPFQLEEVKG